jgi:hypothetical protein
MVDHLTTVWPAHELDPPRIARMASALDDLGFEQQASSDRVSFTSGKVEAQTVKAYLRAHGFRDREFRLVLEYVRQWGML